MEHTNTGREFEFNVYGYLTVSVNFNMGTFARINMIFRMEPETKQKQQKDLQEAFILLLVQQNFVEESVSLKKAMIAI